jgi:hypothetical protein
MNAENSQAEDSPVKGWVGRKVFGAALIIGVLLYVFIAWVLQFSGAGRPVILGADRRIVAYAVMAFIGLGSAIGSFMIRKLMVAGPNAAQGNRPVAALFVGLALAETPALLGLIYFVFSYDWPGFLLLVAASLVCFILHMRWR